MDSLRDCDDECGHEADHDDRQHGAEEDRREASGNAHFILLGMEKVAGAGGGIQAKAENRVRDEAL